jgi:hypothetical protein
MGECSMRITDMLGVSGWVRGSLEAVGRGASRRVLPVIVSAGLWTLAATAVASPLAGESGAPTGASGTPPQSIANVPRKADFAGEAPSAEAQEVAHWIMHSADNRNLPFMLVDKVQARVYVFHADGRLRGASSALLGLAIGDHTVPGIGQRKLSSIRPEERTTGAGRFMASLDRDIHGVEVLWVDYDSALSLHRVVPGTPKERRAQRLASSSPADKRITYGCINVPVRFYEEVVSPAFKGTYGVVYVLPETRPAREVFGMHAVRSPANPLTNVSAVMDASRSRSLPAQP